MHYAEFAEDEVATIRPVHWTTKLTSPLSESSVIERHQGVREQQVEVNWAEG
jgi:hypothetical protein